MPEFHTELQHLTQQQLQLLQQENQDLKRYLQVMKTESKDLMNTIELQQTYQLKLQQLITSLDNELLLKDQQIQQYQNYLFDNTELPDQTSLSNSLAPLLKQCLDTYLCSQQFQDQVQQHIEAKLSSYSSSLEMLHTIDWSNLQYPEKSIERELDNVLSEAKNMSDDLRELVTLYQQS